LIWPYLFVNRGGRLAQNGTSTAKTGY